MKKSHLIFAAVALLASAPAFADPVSASNDAGVDNIGLDMKRGYIHTKPFMARLKLGSGVVTTSDGKQGLLSLDASAHAFVLPFDKKDAEGGFAIDAGGDVRLVSDPSLHSLELRELRSPGLVTYRYTWRCYKPEEGSSDDCDDTDPTAEQRKEGASAVIAIEAPSVRYARLKNTAIGVDVKGAELSLVHPSIQAAGTLHGVVLDICASAQPARFILGHKDIRGATGTATFAPEIEGCLGASVGPVSLRNTVKYAVLDAGGYGSGEAWAMSLSDTTAASVNLRDVKVDVGYTYSVDGASNATNARTTTHMVNAGVSY